MSNFPYVSSQPRKGEYFHSSLHEENVLAVALNNEWETEWNHLGMTSRLTKEVVRENFSCFVDYIVGYMCYSL